jgi:hypothetical protein
MNPHRCNGITRRSFLADTGMGFTGLALGAMLGRDARAEEAWASAGWAASFSTAGKVGDLDFLCAVG